MAGWLMLSALCLRLAQLGACTPALPKAPAHLPWECRGGEVGLKTTEVLGLLALALDISRCPEELAESGLFSAGSGHPHAAPEDHRGLGPFSAGSDISRLFRSGVKASRPPPAS